jgi:hypothetical protein
MAIAVFSLDDRVYADLVDEARSLIPVYDPSWTNHNESDPGITLMEMFAWLAEMQIYALDQITDEHRLTFLRLLNGPDLEAKRNADWTIDKAWLDQKTAETLQLMRQTTRAVSAADYELLAGRVTGVTRAQCVPRRNLDAGNEALRLDPAPGHVSIVILPSDPTADAAALCSVVSSALEPARMLTTRLHVVPPTWVPIATRITVARRPDSPPDLLQGRITKRLADWLSAWTGGTGNGWPFGRNVYVSELNAVLEAIDGVDYVGDAMLDSLASTEQEQAALPLWHDGSGVQVGLALGPHQLPRSSPPMHQVAVADRLEPVHLKVSITPGLSKPALARRIVMQSLKNYLWTLQGGGKQSFTLSQVGIRNCLSVSAVTEVVSSVGVITIEANPGRRKTSAESYEFKAGELFHAHIEIAETSP